MSEDMEEMQRLSEAAWAEYRKVRQLHDESGKALGRAAGLDLTIDFAKDCIREGRRLTSGTVFATVDGYGSPLSVRFWGGRPADAIVEPIEVVRAVAERKLDPWTARLWLKHAPYVGPRQEPRRPYPRTPEPTPCPECGGECRTVGIPVDDAAGNQTDMVDTVSECQSCSVQSH